MLTYPIRNLSPEAASDQNQSAQCEKCEKLASQLAYLNQWIRETENPKMKKALEKTMEAMRGTSVLHKFEQHSSRLTTHPVRSGLSRAQNWPRPRMQALERDGVTELPKRPK
jgi:ribosomal 50S subunit-associated protein YjgA (DUF615 family)